MYLLHQLYRQRLRASLLLVVLLSLAGGTFAAVRAQAKACKVVDLVEICGESLREYASGWEIEGLITIGMADKPPVVLVTDILDEPDVEDDLKVASVRYYERIAGSDKNIILVRGEVHLRNDPNAEALVQSRLAKDASGSPTLRPGVLVLDTTFKKLLNPTDSEAQRYFVEHGEQPARANSGLRMHFLERARLGWYEQRVEEAKREQVVIEYDLEKRVMRAQAPLPDLPYVDYGEGGERTQARFELTFREDGSFERTLKSLRVRLAGLVGEVIGVQVKDLTPSQTSASLQATPVDADGDGELDLPDSVGFEAEAIVFHKADNQSLPNLDPSDPGSIFRLDGIRYQNGRLSLAGSVPLKDWRLGDALQLTSQRASISYDGVGRRYGLVVSSTLSFAGANNVVTDTTRYPIVLRFSAKEAPGGTTTAMSATLGTARPSLGIGPLRIRPENVGLLFDPEQNFYGLTAERVGLQWGGELGSAAGPAITGFRLGVDRDKKLKFNLGAGGSVDLPEIRTAALRGTFRGTIGVKDERLEAQLDGALRVALPGNFGAVPTATLTLRRGPGVVSRCRIGQANCVEAVDFRLAGFDIKLAGFTLSLQNPRGYNGGFAADIARLMPPAGMSFVGGEVRGLKVSGRGDVTFDGGGVSLPPIKMGKIQFTDVRGFFAKNATGYEFRAEGVLPLPGMTGAQKPGPSDSSRQIRAQLTFKTRPTGAINSLGVAVDFKTTSPGIAIGGTGMELLEIGGRFDLDSGTAKIGVRMKAGSQLKLGTLPVATLAGNAELQFNPTRFKANAELTVLVLKVANASLGIGAGEGFNGGDGFNVAFNVDLTLVRGDVRLRLGKVVLSNGRKELRVAASATVKVGIKKSQILPLLPPVDLNLAGVTLKGGHFKTRGGAETLGLMGTVECCIFYEDTVFVDLRTKEISFPNPKNYTLLDEATVAARARAGEQGYALRAMSGAELSALGLGEGPRALRLQTPLYATIPFTVTTPGTTVFGLRYPAPAALGHPLLAVRLPNGTSIDEQAVDNRSSTLVADTTNAEGGYDKALVIKDAPAGVYILTIANAPSAYDPIFYTLNQPPRLENVRATCAPYRPGGNLAVSTWCDGTLSDDAVTLTWQVQDVDSSERNVYVGYVADPGPGAEIDTAQMKLLAENLPAQSTYSVQVGTSGIPSGKYRLVIGARDGENAPVEWVSPQVIQVQDREAPEALKSLRAEAQPGAVLVRWDASAWPDVAGYEVGFGPTSDPAQFTYTRDLGEVEAPAPGEQLDATLWGLEDGQEIFVSVRAYDQDGNAGAWAAPVAAQPWPLSPEAYMPLPGGQGYPDSSVRLMFDTPMAPDGVQGRLSLKRAGGPLIAGQSELITSFDGAQVLGLRFVPTAPLAVGERYEVTIKGGIGGVVAADGRGMPADYSWIFNVVERPQDASTALVPLEPEPEAPLAEGGDRGDLPPPADEPDAPDEPDDPPNSPASRRLNLPLVIR